MRWVDLAVKPYFSWPNIQVDFLFEGRRVTLQPASDECSCTISLYDEKGLTFEEGGHQLCRFLSRLAWSKDAGVIELFIVGSNNPANPGRTGRGTYGHSPFSQITPTDLLYFPSPKDEKSELALALYREGMNLSSVTFAFLSFFKIINMLDSKGKQQVAWINNNLGKISFQPAIDRLNELKKNESDIGHYLYVKGRCAVSHAFAEPIANPDKYEDKRRFELDLPLMKELSALCIEQEFGVLSEISFWKIMKKNDADGSAELLKKMLLDENHVQYIPL